MSSPFWLSQSPFQKQIALQPLSRRDRILIQVLYADPAYHLVVDEEMAAERLAVAQQDGMRRIRHDGRLARSTQDLRRKIELDGGGGDGGARPQAVHRNAVR